jgi:MFS transporter, NNP family, nitrate/nitrite transporter
VAGIWSFTGRHRILHFTWFAFFLTFVIWFNFAPFATAVKAEMGLSEAQMRTLAICNVALTVPARIIVGMILDRFGPRITYSCLLIYAAFPCLAFAMSQNFTQLVYSRLALSIVGCGFVIGIRMVAEWFPPKEIGLAEGMGKFWFIGSRLYPTRACRRRRIYGRGATQLAVCDRPDRRHRGALRHCLFL